MGKDHDLLEAARNGNIALVGKLLDQITKRNGPLSSFRRSPSINGQDVNGYTPLHHACLNGHSNVVCLLLAHHATPDVPDIRGSTPLYLAAWAGHQDIVKMLLMYPQKPANPNAQTIENETPLHCAAQHGHNAALAILLAYGADPTIRNNSFQTALDLASQFGRLQAVQILIRNHSELLEPLKSKEQISEVKSSPPSMKHMFTHTCLHLASRNGHKKVVATLLAAGVDVNILTHSGTALHEAALCGKKSVVSILLNAGVDPNATDGNGRTALDILKDYPPHVTYEIVSVINDFCKQKLNAVNPKPVSNHKGTHEQNGIRDKSHSMPKSVYEKKSKNAIGTNKTNIKAPQNTIPKVFKPVGLSSSLSSLESAKPTASYLKMKPIMWQKSSSDISGQLTDKEPDYKPVYRQPCIIAINKQREISAKEENVKNHTHKSYEHIYLKKSSTASETGSGSEVNFNKSNLKTTTRPYNCVDEYVVMSDPNSSKTSLNSITLKKPFPSPRNFEGFDSANTNSITNEKIITPMKDKKSTPTSSNLVNLPKTDSNNNKEHSPSPEFPPPSVTQAEHTIIEFIQPMTLRNKRRSIRIQETETLENFDSIVIETFDLEDSSESLGSRISDCVEKFVSDEPFAGLFKGSTINLALDENETLEQKSRKLRSPSLVKSIKPIPAQRKLSLQKNGQDEFNESMVWEEINTILESIGNEVANADATMKTNDVPQEQTKSGNTQEFFRIRNPSDLSLGISNNLNTNWCHSANTLIYKQILYNVFYLGSTVIRVLRGTASTRKSIQRLKRDETPPEENELEVGLVKDCNTSTKYLKASNQQTRLKVGIALSHIGVKFIDINTKSTFCVHDIENINCVCQDADDLRYFAYITKENDIHYCHVFMVDTLELATEIILTLGQAFEVAYQLALTRVKSPIVEVDGIMESY